MRWIWLIAISALTLSCASRGPAPDAAMSGATTDAVEPEPAAPDDKAPSNARVNVTLDGQLEPELEGFTRGFSDLLALDLQARGVLIESRNRWEMHAPVNAVDILAKGSTQQFPFGLRIDMNMAWLTSEPPGQVVAAVGANGQADEFPQMLQALSSSFAKALGNANSDDEPVPQTTSLAALLALGRGLAALDQGDRDAAIEHLDAAIAEDPGFERAQALRTWLANIREIPMFKMPDAP